jgi:hypothetical protein
MAGTAEGERIKKRLIELDGYVRVTPSMCFARLPRESTALRAPPPARVYLYSSESQIGFSHGWLRSSELYKDRLESDFLVKSNRITQMLVAVEGFVALAMSLIHSLIPSASNPTLLHHSR